MIEEGTHETLMKKEGSKYQTMVKSQQIERINDDDDKEDTMNLKETMEEDEKMMCMFIF